MFYQTGINFLLVHVSIYDVCFTISVFQYCSLQVLSVYINIHDVCFSICVLQYCSLYVLSVYKYMFVSQFLYFSTVDTLQFCTKQINCFNKMRSPACSQQISEVQAARNDQQLITGNTLSEQVSIRQYTLKTGHSKKICLNIHPKNRSQQGYMSEYPLSEQVIVRKFV